jgi:preprotein translocase subunit YajC
LVYVVSRSLNKQAKKKEDYKMNSNVAMIVWLVALFAIMYFLMIRPQQKQKKKRESMLTTLKKGDHIVTIGGIHGYIYSINDTMMTLEVATGVYLQFNRSSVGYVVEDNAAAAGEPEQSAQMLTEDSVPKE